MSVRALFLALGALALPACHHGDNEIFISNGGGGSVIVEIWHRDGVDVFELPAGASWKGDFEDGDTVSVFIHRRSDGFILFADDFDDDDFDDDHGKVEIFVYP